MRRVRKAIIPAAGFGTRFLPFTKSVPKELVPLVDKPVIQYVIEEAAAAGIEEILVVVSPGKEALIRHFNPEAALNARLTRNGKTELLAELEKLECLAEIHYVCQAELDGLGGAILRGRSFAGNEPFAVLLGDTVMESFTDRPVIGELIRIFEARSASVMALEEVPEEKLRKYGIAAGSFVEPDLLKLSDIVEKPEPEAAPSRLAVASRYVFTPELFDALAATKPGRGGEIQLPDANRRMLGAGIPLYGKKFSGRRHDLGDKLSFLKSTVEFGLKRPEFQARFAEFILETAQKLKKEL